MNLLLDTHIILWWLEDDPSLQNGHRRLIGDERNLCHISAASIWEISIKKGLGKLEIPDNYIKVLYDEGFMELPVTWLHCDSVASLPPLHRDPFDRLLIAQACLEKLIIVTVDEKIKQYKVSTV